ncbi:UDP-2,3-diacylglucosamine diphosphatase [Melioribacteraceae bacterium 4301-Me]|uniref:UDP-2,3-diacylglucosamine diphosphatase n=1 Tax=Pyranulibacter aquaticus TaxID=3163344 RepID=UPI003596C43E
MSEIKTYFFISDIHLGLQQTEIEKVKENLLVNFLRFAKKNCDELFILGDLFDYWFEYKRVIQKGFYKTITALKELSEEGIIIHYLIGNHDFLHRDFFTKEIGIKLYENDFTITLNQKKFYLGHGDDLVTNDVGYKILKKILRNKFLQRIYSLIHPDLGIKIASSTSKKSRNYTKTKNFGEVDGLLEAAKKMIDDGVDYVILGHSHQREFVNYKNGYYINLGSWIEKPCYGKFKDSFEIIEWDLNGRLQT